MELKEYLKLKELSVAKLAKCLDVTAQYLWFVVSGSKRPSEKLAFAIEEVTEGLVKAYEVRKPHFCPTCHREYTVSKLQRKVVFKNNV